MLTDAGSELSTSGQSTEVPRSYVPEIARVSIRVPPFWKANPALWFCQLEAQFENTGIQKDLTKYNTVVSSIESEILNQVSDIVLNPPVSNRYLALKKRLLDQFTDSDQKNY